MTTGREFKRQADVGSAEIAGTGVRRTHAMGARIKTVTRRDETIRRLGGNGDNWHMSWGADDRQYLSLCDGAGFSDDTRMSYNSRMLAIAGGPSDATFHDLPGYPVLGAPTQGRTDPRYYNFGTLALDGYLYQFLSTFNRTFRLSDLANPNAQDLLRFNGVKLIYSPDNGRTWHNQHGSTPVVWESWQRRSRETMVFFEEDQDAFSLLSVLQMGKNYEHNRDGYVYVYAPNGSAEGAMNELVMFRAPKDGLLDRSSYEFFAGVDAGGAARWTPAILARAVVHTFPRGWVNKLAHPYAWHPSVVYNAPLGVYLMVNWGMGTGSGIDGLGGIKADDLWFTKPSYLGFWVAANPWGPWTQIHEETAWMPGGDPASRAYQPQIAPKWIAPDGRSFWLVWTDFQTTDIGAMKRYIEESERKADSNSYTEEDVMRRVAMERRCMPYYAFNIQRVDLEVA